MTAKGRAVCSDRALDSGQVRRLAAEHGSAISGCTAPQYLRSGLDLSGTIRDLDDRHSFFVADGELGVVCDCRLRLCGAAV